MGKKLEKALENLIYVLSILLYEWVKLKMLPNELIIYALNIFLAFLGFMGYRYMVEARAKLKRVADFILKLEKALEDNRITVKEVDELIASLKAIIEPEVGED